VEISKSFYENDIIVLELTGEVDAHTAQNLNTSLMGLLAQGHRRIVIDFSNITFISSSGLRVIMIAHREAVQFGGEIRLSGPNDQVMRIFEIAGIYELFHISDTFQDSINSWQYSGDQSNQDVS
jgi:anti-anti-sigma factor